MRIQALVQTTFLSILILSPACHTCQKDLPDQYKKAVSIAPNSTNTSVRPPVQEWKLDFKTQAGASVRIEALRMPFHSVYATYSDEKESHVVYDYFDYVSPRAIRKADHLLFVRVTGLGGGIIEEDRIYCFDLEQRKLISWCNLPREIAQEISES